ncbi:GNAT family N-acetyltransferase [Paenibacillus sp. MWE-103]|uniref:GNAT family N-acetyltransferase n=1 Tax=Paenibacillus artemisiicola TaxID=1172618 RepID=A0ABS3W7Q4_9BACL|nr:GNAT family N-acetyltransferase [Paenibacillus artemisiicola]MBO7744308.1 GNAT family N-acetyltransferase [Paenibacillus artemisiicola]
MTYMIHDRLPTVAEHRLLWEAVGWGSVDAEMAAGSLRNSLYGVVVTVDDAPVGMGRIVGDDSMYFYIQDVAILPVYQGHGLGKEIMNRLLAYIEKRRYENGIAFVGLFASEGKEAFYEAFGIQNHASHMTGMFTVLEKR